MMNILISILAFVVILSVIVFIHELGHFITAKKFGVYCGEFSIGMGPLLWKKQGKETQYSVRALPIGGFVSMAGEADDTKADADVPFERTINGITWWKKIIVMLAGIIMNLILAWVIFVAVTMSQGQVVVGTQPVISAIAENSAASTSGLKTGDKIIKLVFADGEVTNVKKSSDISTSINFHPKEKVVITVIRSGKQLKIAATPKYDPNSEAYLLGIMYQNKVKSIQWYEAFGYGTNKTIDNSTLIFESLNRLAHGKNLSQLSGPVGIFKITGKAANSGFTTFLTLLALLSLNIGIFNAIPIPILDGGRALITLIEKIVGRTINEKVMDSLMYIGVALLIFIMIFATYNDIQRIF